MGKRDSCRYEMKNEDDEIKLVVDCRRCDTDDPGLERDECLAGIMGAWEEALGADSIVLSGTVETQYSGDAVELIRQISELARDLDRLARRTTPVAGTKDGKRCEGCRLSPTSTFGDLANRLYGDLVGFYRDYRARAMTINDASFHDRRCSRCLERTRDDMIFISDRFEGLLRFVIRGGFSIVL